MPIYEYECPDCNGVDERYFCIDEYDTPVICPNCSSLMSKIPSKISLGYVSKFKVVERKANEEGHIIREPGLDKDAKRAKEYQEEKRRKSIRKSVEQTVMDHVI